MGKEAGKVSEFSLPTSALLSAFPKAKAQPVVITEPFISVGTGRGGQEDLNDLHRGTRSGIHSLPFPATGIPAQIQR